LAEFIRTKTKKTKLFSILLLISKNCKDHQEEVEEEVSHSPTHVFTKTTIHACHTERRRERKEKDFGIPLSI
jgi:hypothetical protein